MARKTTKKHVETITHDEASRKNIPTAEYQLVMQGGDRSNGPEGIACWFIDTDYSEESFFVLHAYFLGANDLYMALKTNLKAENKKEAWVTLLSDTSCLFAKPKSGRIAVKVINHLGDKVIKVFWV